MSMESKRLAQEDLDRGDYVWLENLQPNPSVFRHASGTTVRLEPTGYFGSVEEVPIRVARDSFLRRSIARGLIREIKTDEEAWKRMEELKDRPTAKQTHAERVLAATGEGASERTGLRYTKEGLADNARPSGPDTVISEKYAKEVAQPAQEASQEPQEPQEVDSGLKHTVTKTMKEGEPFPTE